MGCTVLLFVLWSFSIPLLVLANPLVFFKTRVEISNNISDFGSQLVIPNFNPAFIVECLASYPVEWIVRYGQDQQETSDTSHIIENYREVLDFKNSSTYNFRSILSVKYNGKLEHLSHFSCKSTRDFPIDQTTHLNIHYIENKSKLFLKVSHFDKFPDNTSIEKTSVEQECKIKVSVTHVIYNNVHKFCWKCINEDGKKLVVDFKKCTSATECKNVYNKIQKGKMCLTKKPDSTEPQTCNFYNPRDYNPFLVICKNLIPAQAHFYFHGVFHGDVTDKTISPPQMYFDWNDVERSEMIYFHPFKEIVYLGEPITFTCEYSRFYFSLGSWHAIKGLKVEKYIKGNDKKFWGEHSNAATDAVEARRGTYKAKLTVEGKMFSEVGQYEAFCIGPVWNTSGWINASRNFWVQKGVPPHVVNIASENGLEFYFGDIDRTLRCEFRGIPIPTVIWHVPNNISVKVINGDNYTDLIIAEIGFKTGGYYNCSVNSNLGSSYKLFKLVPKSSKLSVIIIISIIICVLVFVTLVGCIFVRMRLTIIMQRKQLRLLTDKEVHEFVTGNPVILNEAKTKGFETAAAIDALPYDTMYEISPENLVVDYNTILGEGAYGIVLKGRIKPILQRDRYINLLQWTDDLVAAVKTSKKDVDVNIFKSLLSELKVMAYLGSHENLVSLIGATTNNIKNRELLIAVEYCEAGSLDYFLTENKHRFTNKVKNGEISLNYSSVNESYVNLADRNEFVTEDLFRWCAQIAHGVQYLHEKKVIHADLAIRNVMLNHNLVAKVGDFGLSRQLIESATYTKQSQCPLPWRNMAFESLKKLEFSFKSDIWALGVTYWELFYFGEKPYPGMTYNFEFLKQLEDGMRLEQPPFTTKNMYDFMLQCWNLQPDHRPTLHEAVDICENNIRIHEDPE